VSAVRVNDWPLKPRVPGAPEPLPVDVLPSVLRDVARTASGAFQAPLDAAIAAAIGGVSVAIVGKAHVEICPRRGWRKPVHTYVGIQSLSGTGKSPLLGVVRDPISRWEAERAADLSLDRRFADEAVRVAEERVKTCRREAASNPGVISDGALREAVKELERAEAKPRGAFQLLLSDVTEEELGRVLAANGYRAGSVDPEATILEVAAGRYGNGDARLTALTHGWDGEAMKVNRVSRPPLNLPVANLALLLALQPGILKGMLNAETMRQRGVLDRFLWVAPEFRWDDLLTGRDVPDLDAEAVKRYGKALRRILDSPDKSDKPEDPHVLKMSPEAQEGVYRLERAKKDGMRPGGLLRVVPAFAGKLPDHGSRLAALLTVADRADRKQKDLYRDPIPGWAMEGAERLVAAIATHVVKVLGAGGAEPSDPEYLLGLCVEMEGCTESEIRERARARTRFRDVEHARTIFDDLEERGCIRRLPQERTAKVGRDPSPRIAIHESLKGSDISEKPGWSQRNGSKSDIPEAPTGLKSETEPEPWAGEVLE